MVMISFGLAVRKVSEPTAGVPVMRANGTELFLAPP